MVDGSLRRTPACHVFVARKSAAEYNARRLRQDPHLPAKRLTNQLK
jgi:hypothetical protein